MRIALCWYALYLLFLAPQLVAQENAFAYNLQCEHLSDPIGLDRENPRFSWKLNDSRYGARQTAYRVKVYQTTEAGSSLVWDSGKKDENTNLIRYQGDPLESFTAYTWQLQLWDKDNSPLEERSGTFETGMMESGDWLGSWITDAHSPDYRPASMFRKAFNLEKPVKRARLYIATAGLHDISLNGQRVTDEFLNPVFTRYDKRILYNSYDITENLQQGENAIGLILGNGWYNHQVVTVLTLNQAVWRNRPAFLANLKITFDDDTEITIASDNDWKYTDSPVTFNSIYASESYDFRKEIPGWDKADFEDQAWETALITTSPTQKVEAQVMPPIMRTDTLRPVSMERFNLGRYLFKFPRNMAGIVELKGSGSRNTKVLIRHSEVITPFDQADNSHFKHVYPDPLPGEAFHEDIIYLDGGPFTFSPKFNYKGFQYVEVIANKPLELTEESIVAYPVNSHMRQSGHIQTSNQIINKTWQATNNSYLSNMMGYPTDCPQREKNGWTGDAHLMAESGLYNFNSILVYEKWLRDHQDAQLPNGELPMLIPASHWGYHFPALDWTSSMIIIPWEVYQKTGDPHILEENYEAMKNFHGFWEKGAFNYILDHNGFADWQTVQTPSSPRLIASAFYYYCTELMSKIALELGHTQDFIRFDQIARNSKAQFNNLLYKPNEGIYEGGTQTELALALAFGLTTDENNQMVATALAKKIENNGGFLDVGVIGTKVLLEALVNNGLSHVAFDLAKEKDYPSWGFWMEQGLTTLPEGWNYRGWGFGASVNHAFFGSISAWMYKTIGGIHSSRTFPGFKIIELKPQFDFELGSVDIWHDSPQGRIATQVNPIDNSAFEYTVTIPPGSTAQFLAPDGFTVSAFEDGSVPPEYIPQRNRNGQLEFESGTYTFTLSEETDQSYPFPEKIIDPNEGFGNLMLEEGQVYFKQGSLNGTSAQVRLIDQTGKVVEEYALGFLTERNRLMDLSKQLSKNQVLTLLVEVIYEDLSKRRFTKRLLKNED